jgi:hypothetical protein
MIYNELYNIYMEMGPLRSHSSVIFLVPRGSGSHQGSSQRYQHVESGRGGP